MTIVNTSSLPKGFTQLFTRAQLMALLLIAAVLVVGTMFPQGEEISQQTMGILESLNASSDTSNVDSDSDAIAMSFQTKITILLMGGIVYALLLSMPFVPGFELGLAIILLMGNLGVIVVYIATVAGLNLAFALGRCLPERYSTRLLSIVLKNKDGKLVDFPQQNFAAEKGIVQRVGRNIFVFASRCPYLLLAMLFNLPGNTAIGGGGGIALVSGMNDRVSWLGYLVTVMIATSPIPILASLGLLTVQSLSG